MATIKTQIHDYINNTVHRDSSYPQFKAWNYIDNIGDISRSTLPDYTGPSDYARIMDVAAIWEHCAGGAESPCDGSGTTALSKITRDRQLIQSAGFDSQVELVFLVQTFTMNGGYEAKFTLDQLKNYSTEFINTSALDGFMYYTWDEGWYSGNLKRWTDLQPAVLYIHNYISGLATPTPITSPTAVPTVVNSPTLTPSVTPVPFTPTVTPRPTATPTPRPTSTPTPRPTNTPTVTPRPTSTPAPTATRAPSPTLTPQTSKIMNISSIYYSRTSSWYGGKKLTVHIKVTDKSNGNGLFYAKVWYKLINTTTGRTWEKSGYTNTNGEETFSVSNAPSGCYRTVVSQVTRFNSWTWNGITPTNEFCF
jgi:hypothetical protein